MRRPSAPQGRLLFCFSSSQWPQALWLWLGPCSLCPVLPRPLPVCLCPDPPLTKTLAVGFRAHPKLRRPHFAIPNLITSAKTLSPSKVACTGSRAYFVGTQFAHCGVRALFHPADSGLCCVLGCVPGLAMWTAVGGVRFSWALGSGQGCGTGTWRLRPASQVGLAWLA